MKFYVEFTDLDKRGYVEATLTTLNITTDGTQAKIPVVRYKIEFPTEKIVLHKIVESEEWLPFALHPHIPDYIVKRSMIEIEKFESTQGQSINYLIIT